MQSTNLKLSLGQSNGAAGHILPTAAVHQRQRAELHHRRLPRGDLRDRDQRHAGRRAGPAGRCQGRADPAEAGAGRVHHRHVHRCGCVRSFGVQADANVGPAGSTRRTRRPRCSSPRRAPAVPGTRRARSFGCRPSSRAWAPPDPGHAAGLIRTRNQAGRAVGGVRCSRPIDIAGARANRAERTAGSAVDRWNLTG